MIRFKINDKKGMKIGLNFTQTNNIESANVNSIWNVTSIENYGDSSLNTIINKYCQSMTYWIKNVIINFSVLTNEKNKICGFETPLRAKNLLNFNKEIDNNDIKTTLTRWCQGEEYPWFNSMEPFSMIIGSLNSQTHDIYELENVSLQAITHDIFSMYHKYMIY